MIGSLIEQVDVAPEGGLAGGRFGVAFFVKHAIAQGLGSVDLGRRLRQFGD